MYIIEKCLEMSRMLSENRPECATIKVFYQSLVIELRKEMEAGKFVLNNVILHLIRFIEKFCNNQFSEETLMESIDKLLSVATQALLASGEDVPASGYVPAMSVLESFITAYLNEAGKGRGVSAEDDFVKRVELVLATNYPGFISPLMHYWERYLMSGGNQWGEDNELIPVRRLMLILFQNLSEPDYENLAWLVLQQSIAWNRLTEIIPSDLAEKCTPLEKAIEENRGKMSATARGAREADVATAFVNFGHSERSGRGSAALEERSFSEDVDMANELGSGGYPAPTGLHYGKECAQRTPPPAEERPARSSIVPDQQAAKVEDDIKEFFI